MHTFRKIPRLICQKGLHWRTNLKFSDTNAVRSTPSVQIPISTSQEWAESACLGASVNTALLGKHCTAVFKAACDYLLPDPKVLCRESYLNVVKVLVAKVKLINAKTPGPKEIRSKLIKCRGRVTDTHLLKVFNNCWKGVQPILPEWVAAEVVSLYKKKSKMNDPNNYRGVFLLNAIHIKIIPSRKAWVVRIRLP